MDDRAFGRLVIGLCLVLMLFVALSGCTAADPYGPQFTDYTKDNPVDWRSGFIVLTFHDGELLRPQEVQVVREGVVEYRGDRFTV